MTDFTREIRRRHTSIDRYKGFDRLWTDFDQSFKVRQILDSVVENQMDVATAREQIRRNYILSVRGIEALFQKTDALEKNSPEQLFKTMEIIQAAAVGSCDLSQRNRISMSLAEATAKAGVWERTRQALADAMEGLQIFRRFFIDEEHFITEIEEELKESWGREKPHLKNRLDIFEPLSDNPSREWINFIFWNSDSSPENDLIAQSDATIRLGIRFDYWLNRKNLLEPVIREMSEICKSLNPTDPIDPARCLVTIADALMEVKHWGLAAEIHQEIRAQVRDENLVTIHTAIQTAYCHLETRNLELCRKTLQHIDRSILEKMADSDRAAAGELARFHSVNCQYNERSGRPFPPDASYKIHQLLLKASSLVNWLQWSENRRSHLKNLYYSMLIRDILSHSRQRLT